VARDVVVRQGLAPDGREERGKKNLLDDAGTALRPPTLSLGDTAVGAGRLRGGKRTAQRPVIRPARPSRFTPLCTLRADSRLYLGADNVRRKKGKEEKENMSDVQHRPLFLRGLLGR